ncbi:hypothetical protein NQ317_007584 [Molorchus minor]|uniref:Regulatory protein zeste n=1 Tax=Molorchus minor TaxID=1323400 RepID=A0ABQ9IVF7_9CUCU|nr:hypothetical protein NQ317_007584 [Molorchus minor]
MRIIANKYASTLEDKKTDRTSTTQKEKTWKAIEDEFSASSSCSTYRNATCLKKCYENRKKELRKALAEERKQTMLTGGGPPPKIIKGETDDLLLSIVNKKTLLGLDNPYDDDADESPINFNEKVNDKYDDVVVEYIDERDGAIAEKPLPFNISENSQENPTSPPVQAEHSTSEVSLSGSDPKWKKYTPQHLQLPISAALTANEPEAGSNNKTPKKGTSRRRPTTILKPMTLSDIAKKYDVLLDKRLQLIDVQRAHIEAEHTLHMRKCQLEIEILEIELCSKNK